MSKIKKKDADMKGHNGEPSYDDAQSAINASMGLLKSVKTLIG